MSEEAQKTYVNNGYEYPVHNKVKPDDIVSNWGMFKIDSLDLNALGKFQRMQSMFLKNRLELI